MGTTIILKGVNAYEKAMKDVKNKMATAAAAAVTKTAYTARKNAISNIEKNFTLRNTFTTRQIFTTPARKSTSLKNIKAYTGALDPAGYMARQETGGIKKSDSGANLIIPNTRARGGANTNKVQDRYTYKNVIKNTVRWSNRNGSRRARMVATAYYAAKQSKKHPKFMRIGNSFFRISKFRKTKGSTPKVKFTAQQILNLKHKTTYTPQKEWLKPASEYAEKLTPQFYQQEMDKL